MNDADSPVTASASTFGTADYGTTVEIQTGAPGASAVRPHGQTAPVTGPGSVLRQRYVLEQWLGRGGMANVFKARDRYRLDLPESQQFVAVKIPFGDPRRRAEVLKNLRREFFCAQKLSHRNIVKVYEVDRDGDIEFFTMELLEGELLSNIMERMPPASMPRAHAWTLINEIGMGLAHAHARGVVHSDLKPHNILVTQSGEVRILDFGASSYSTPRANPEAANEPRSALTPAYASCELLEGRPAEPSDDLYAFACIAYELLAGRHPFQRRPSTEARNLGIVPTRPRDLSRRQWQALKMGLSWHRAGRSIPFRVWLDRLATERHQQPLPPPADLKPTPAAPRYTAPLKAAALCAGIVAVFTAVLLVSAAPGKKLRGDAIMTAAATAENAAAVAADGPASAVVTPPIANPTPPVENIGVREQRAKTSVRAPGPPLVAAANYKIRAGDRFAEVRVHRAASLPGNAAFVWWTESASAKPGVDYVQTGKVTQLFPQGKTSTSFFVRLVPTASRSEPQVFYIAVAAADHGASTGQIARTAIWLPTNRDPS